jgi:hypothetical protein
MLKAEEHRRHYSTYAWTPYCAYLEENRGLFCLRRGRVIASHSETSGLHDHLMLFRELYGQVHGKHSMNAELSESNRIECTASYDIHKAAMHEPSPMDGACRKNGAVLDFHRHQPTKRI